MGNCFEKNIHLKKKRNKKSPNQAGKRRMEEETSSSWIGEEQTAGNSWTMIWIHVAQNFGATSNCFSWSKKMVISIVDGEGSYLISKTNFSSSFKQTNLGDVAKNLKKSVAFFFGTSTLCALIYHGPFCLSLTCHTFKVTIATLLLGPSSCRKLEPR